MNRCSIGGGLPVLAAELRAHGVEHVTIETNATIWDPALARDVDLWSLSPKLPDSGERADPAMIATNPTQSPGRVQLKFVVTSANDLTAMWELLDRVDLVAGAVLVQPDGTRVDYDIALRELIAHVLGRSREWHGVPRRRPCRVTPQVHRVAWGRGRARRSLDRDPGDPAAATSASAEAEPRRQQRRSALARGR